MRIIPKIEIKNNTLVKGISFEGLRVLGSPDFFISNYEQNIADEFFLIDVTASLYGLPFNFDYLKKYCGDLNVPITISGGLRSFEDIQKAFQSGADKVALNTYLYENQQIIDMIKEVYGSQAVVANLEVAKKDGKYELYSEFGREKKNIELNQWLKILINKGIGEIVCSSIYHDGKRNGVDYKLIEILSEIKTIPILYSGGVKSLKEIEYIKKNFDLSGLLVSSFFHYNLLSQKRDEIKKFSNNIGNIDFLKDKKFFDKIDYDKNSGLDFSKKKIKLNIDTNNKLKLGILNLDNGNIFSIINILKKNNIRFELTNKAKDLSKLDVLVVSGDGNCDHCIKQINAAGLQDCLHYFFEKKSILAICSGMQILFEKTYESGVQKGMGFFKGQIKKISEENIRLPNVGWRTATPLKKDIFEIENQKFYFMHSFSVKNYDQNECLYVSKYKNEEIPCVFKKNNSFAFQFHPEKSGINGVRLLKNILENLNN